MKFFNWGLPSAAALVILLALVFAGSGSSETSTQALTPASEAVPASTNDTDGDGIDDAEDRDPYGAGEASAGGEKPSSSGSTSASPRKPQRPKARPSLTACDENIRVKAPQTTCAFAQNVFYGYWLNEREPGTFADSPGIPAYSKAARSMLYVDCSGASKIVCRADDGGYVTFPAAAMAAYTLQDAKRYAATHELGDVPPPHDPGDEPDPVPSEPGDSLECDPNYEGACLDPNAYDYDCEGGTGDGPEYTGRVEVVGADPYELDRDGDGIGCDW